MPAHATDRRSVVDTYFEGFRRSDHDMVLSCLTDDVVWDLPGYRHLVGKRAFDGEIENEDFVGSPTLDLDRTVEEGETIVAIGSGAADMVGGARFHFAYCDVFTFADLLIRHVESYLVPLPDPGDA